MSPLNCELEWGGLKAPGWHPGLTFLCFVWAGNRFLSPGMHVHVSLFPGNRFQRAGAPELLLSSSGQPGRHQAPMNGGRLSGLLPTLSTKYLGCISAFAASPHQGVQGSEKGGKDKRCFCQPFHFL